jgi:GNAT superfamily N-acetyltransferase
MTGDDICVRLARAHETLCLNAIEAECGTIFRSVIGYEWVDQGVDLNEDIWGASIEASTCWVVVERGSDQPIAFLAAKYFGEDIYIAEIGVLTRFQGQKIGALLLSAVEAHARDANLRAVTLTTFSEIPWNGPYYARLGYSPLAQDQAPAYLKAILADEAARGLMAKPRYAMELALR